MSTDFMLNFLSIVGGLASETVTFGCKKPCEAHITPVNRGDIRMYRGVFQNHLPEPVEASFTFEAIREDESGWSVSSRKGTFKAKGMEEIKLSRIAINPSDPNKYELVLKVFSRGIFICGHSIKVSKPAKHAIA